MKYGRLLLTALLAMLLAALCGCSGLNREYLYVSAHEEQYGGEEETDALVVDDYDGLTDAILLLISEQEVSGVVRVYNYGGDISTDVADAVYYVAKQSALGAYAVDYIAYDCTQVVSYYEVTLSITYSERASGMADLITTRGSNAVRTRIASALESYAGSLSMHVYNYEEFDILTYIADYYDQNPELLLAMPQVTLNQYPATGTERVLELEFAYPQTQQRMQSYQTEVQAVTQAAVEYVQYRQTEAERLQLLYFFLSERFDYRYGESPVPVYGVLCEGVANSYGMARSVQILCNALDMECWTVEGSYNDSPWYWNIIRIDGRYYHVDVMRSISEGESELTFRLDSAMGAYSWPTEAYPACTLRPESQLDPMEEDAENGGMENIQPSP